MEQAKISDFYDPMELANGMVYIRSQVNDNEYLSTMYENALELAQDIMSYVGSNPEANRGVALLAASLMTLISESREYFDDEEYLDFSYQFVSVGLPSLLMSILTNKSIIEAKNILEGVPDYGI